MKTIILILSCDKIVLNCTWNSHPLVNVNVKRNVNFSQNFAMVALRYSGPLPVDLELATN